MDKVDEAKTEISNACEEIEKLTPLLEEATTKATQAERIMKETQWEYAKMKNNCDAQCRKIEKLREPADVLRKKVDQDFNRVSLGIFRWDFPGSIKGLYIQVPNCSKDLSSVQNNGRKKNGNGKYQLINPFVYSWVRYTKLH